MIDPTEAFSAIERGDLTALRAALDAGIDVHSSVGGLSLLHLAIDAEADAHAQTGQPLHVDATALLVARGADPQLVQPGSISAEHFATQVGHWLALELFARLRTS